MKKQNKKKSRKILLSLILVLFIGIILTASTYTWFTANKTVTVNQLDVNVSTSTGLQVSVDAKDWKTVITKDDILNASTTYATATNQIPSGATTPVSSAGEVDPKTGFMKMFRGTLAAGSSEKLQLTAEQVTEENGANGDFIAFDLFFQTNEDMPVQLTSNSNVIAGNTDTAIENAGRVAFLPQGNAAAGADPDTEIQPLKASDSTGLKIWEPNFDVHTAAAVQNAKNSYGITTTQTGGSLLKYYGVKADIAKGVDVNSQDPTYFTDMEASGFITSSPKAGIPTTEYLNVFTLKPGITKIRVYMWVEGQDVDCENNASGGDLSFNLQFSALTESA